jgi:uncharacterized protein (DUF1697 family)
MTVFVALLRAVNVGGTGKLPMSDLKAICERAGYTSVSTYIASGNVVFESQSSARVVQARLQADLEAYADRPVGVLVRTAAEMKALLAAQPFPGREPTKTIVIFLDRPPATEALDSLSGQHGEELRLGKRELYVYYPRGQGQSRLKIAAAAEGTARNLNTVARLVEMASEAG